MLQWQGKADPKTNKFKERHMIKKSKTGKKTLPIFCPYAAILDHKQRSERASACQVQV